MPHDTMKAECAHAGNGACWTWACTCGGHGHVEDPAARYEAASSHANAGHGPCLSLMLGHDPPVECGAC